MKILINSVIYWLIQAIGALLIAYAGKTINGGAKVSHCNPLTNVEINILLDKSVKKVFALHLKKDLSFSKIDNCLTLKLPLLEVHEAICLE